MHGVPKCSLKISLDKRIVTNDGYKVNSLSPCNIIYCRPINTIEKGEQRILHQRSGNGDKLLYVNDNKKSHCADNRTVENHRSQRSKNCPPQFSIYNRFTGQRSTFVLVVQYSSGDKGTSISNGFRGLD